MRLAKMLLYTNPLRIEPVNIPNSNAMNNVLTALPMASLLALSYRPSKNGWRTQPCANAKGHSSCKTTAQVVYKSHLYVST
jgi:hypothetical protein